MIILQLILFNLLLLINLIKSIQIPFFKLPLIATSISISTNSNQSPSTTSNSNTNSNSNTKSFKLKNSLHFTLNKKKNQLNSNSFIKTYSESDLISLESLSTSSSSTTSDEDTFYTNISPISTTSRKVWQPTSNEAFQAQRYLNHQQKQQSSSSSSSSSSSIQTPIILNSIDWEENEILLPDITKVETISSLAKMTSNAYASPERFNDWFTLDGKWNVSDSFGWLEDGIRGHVFADETNSTIVIAIKGTSATFIGSSSTSRNDKFNDNLLFSCCCARVDWTWSTVCDCYNGGWTCDENCLEDSVMNESNYYPIATDLYNNITSLYPTSQIWLVGHSLGGALASMLSLTFGVPSVSFEAPGDLIPAKRLHLPLPPGNEDYGQEGLTTHVYHTADPIPQGVCTGPLSTCAIAGFALETKCHTGLTILYDTVNRLGWSVDIRTHTIKGLIENLFIDDWSSHKGKGKEDKKRGWGWWPGKGGDGGDEPEEDDKDGQRGGKGVPEARKEVDCLDCFRWEFV